MGYKGRSIQEIAWDNYWRSVEGVIGSGSVSLPESLADFKSALQDAFEEGFKEGHSDGYDDGVEDMRHI